MPSDSSIFVSVASFCDLQLQFTLSNLFARAEQPEKIFVGVVDQSEDNNRDWIAQQSFASNVRYMQINPVDSRGVSWARSIVLSFYQDEQYFLQVDSHTLFEPGWDSQLIGQLNALMDKVEKPIITTYPPPFEFDEHGQTKVLYEKGPGIYHMRPKEEATLEDGSLKIPFIVTHKHTENDYEIGHHVAGGFLFTLGRFTQEVPYDPYMYFHGEEQNLAIRAYTRGYTILHPRHELIPLCHLYKAAGQEHRGQHWRADLEQQRKFSYSELMRRSDERLKRVVLGDESLGAWSAGLARPLQWFYEESGFDYPGSKLGESKAVPRPDFLVHTVTRHGPMMVVRQDRSVGLSLRKCGHWAKDLLDMALQQVKPGGVVIEVGAGCGEHSVPLMHHLGLNGKLVAIEPNPIAFKLLFANLILNQHLDALPVQNAVGDVGYNVAVQTVNLTRNCYLSRVSLATSPQEPSMPVRAITIDELGLERLHLLKVNVNGLEHLVLAGATETCKRLRPTILLAAEKLNEGLIRQWADTNGYAIEAQTLQCHSEEETRAHTGLWNPTLNCYLMKPFS